MSDCHCLPRNQPVHVLEFLKCTGLLVLGIFALAFMRVVCWVVVFLWDLCLALVVGHCCPRKNWDALPSFRVIEFEKDYS